MPAGQPPTPPRTETAGDASLSLDLNGDQAPVVTSAAARQAWLEALVDVSQQLLHLNDGVRPVVQHIIEHVRELSQARTVTFVGPSRLNEADFEVRLVTGAGAATLLGNTYDKAATLEGRAMNENRGFLSTASESSCHHLHADTEEPAGPLLAVPLDGAADLRGAIVASRSQSQPPFSEVELAMAGDFARQSSIALQLADAQASQEQLRFREDHDVAIRQLHDDLIQQLFGLGVTLESVRLALPSVTGTVLDRRTGDLWTQATSEIDAIISRLRSSLSSSSDSES